jgi:NADH-quinone oxidoreductase subunit J
MLNIDTASLKRLPKRFILTTIIFLAFFMGLLWKVIPKDLAQKAVILPSTLTITVDQQVSLANTSAIGRVLYTEYMTLIEITALLLLVAIVASITLVHRGGRQIKRQSIKKQIMVTKSERIKVIKLASSAKEQG